MLKINEVIEREGRKIKCVEDINNVSCAGCCKKYIFCSYPEFECRKAAREDGKSVIFIDVTEEPGK